jgi:hypothetical protein
MLLGLIAASAGIPLAFGVAAVMTAAGGALLVGTMLARKRTADA